MNFSLKSINAAIGMLGRQEGLYLDTSKISEQIGDSSEYVETAHGLAKLAVPSQIGNEDLFYLLAHPEMIDQQDRSLVIENIRRHIGLPARDADDVRTEFITTPLELGTGSAVGQLAMLRIIPRNINPAKKPVIFYGGVYHGVAMYYAFAVALAKAEGREVYIVSEPGTGASQVKQNSYFSDPRARADHFYEVIEKSVHVAGLTNRSIDIVGHSLGSVPVLLAYYKKHNDPSWLDSRGINIDRFIPISMIPSERARTMGLEFDGLWTIQAMLGMVPNGMRKMSPNGYNRFIGKHTSAEKAWWSRLIEKEGYLGDPLTFITIFNKLNEAQVVTALSAGKDDISFVLGEDDKLMDLDPDSDIVDARGVHVVKGADHSFMCWPSGDGVDTEESGIRQRYYVSMIRAALNGKYLNENYAFVEDSRPLLDQSHAYKRSVARGNLALHYQYADGHNYSVHTGYGFDYGVVKGVKVLADADFAVGLENVDDVGLYSGVNLALRLSPLDWRSYFDLNAGFQYELTNAKPELFSGVRLGHDLFGVNIALTAGYKFDISEENATGNTVPYFGVIFGWYK